MPTSKKKSYIPTSRTLKIKSKQSQGNKEPTQKPAIHNKQQILVGFPNHLFKLEYLPDINLIPTHFIIYEHPVFYGYRDNPGKLNYNKIRLIYVRAAVLAYIDYLNSHINKSGKLDTSNSGGLISVSFISVDDCIKNKNALATEINKIIKGITNNFPASEIAIKYWDPVDTELPHTTISKLFGLNKSFNIFKLDSPLFLTSESDLAEYHSKHATGRFTHSAFYDWQKQRTQHKEFNFPRQSYDTENRGQMPLNTHIPVLPKLHETDIKYLQQAEKYISTHAVWGDKKRPGYSNSLDNIVFPITHDATHDWFQHFLTKKLSHFGKYQDSIDGNGRNYLFHSCISPMLNIGLITPHEVVTATHKYYKMHSTSINVSNYEGFIRQVIGWREYQRYIYLYGGQKMRQSNHFGNRAQLTKAWYSGELGVRPVDDTIKMAFRDGYLHHILRLMVMGNFMNLAGLHPNEVYRWFMEFALDSYDWVMVGNVYSMALWADGGLSMRKPYISSDTYIMTLGTYTKETVRHSSAVSELNHSSSSKNTSSTNTSSTNTSSTNTSSNNTSSSSTSSTNKYTSTGHGTVAITNIGWNRTWYVLFYNFINRCQTQLKSTYYAGLVKAWHNKSDTDKQEILKDAKYILKKMYQN